MVRVPEIIHLQGSKLSMSVVEQVRLNGKKG